MAERVYSQRDVLDKLGIRAGQALAVEAAPIPIEPDLEAQVLARVGRALAEPDEPLDVVLIGADDSTDVIAVLRRFRARLRSSGAVWVLTPKRGQAGYVNHANLIPHGVAAGLVDNKVCSVSDRTSAIRFVLRRADRQRTG